MRTIANDKMYMMKTFFFVLHVFRAIFVSYTSEKAPRKIYTFAAG